MTKQLLHGTQILARFQQVAGKRVAQAVGVKMFGQAAHHRELC